MLHAKKNDHASSLPFLLRTSLKRFLDAIISVFPQECLCYVFFFDFRFEAFRLQETQSNFDQYGKSKSVMPISVVVRHDRLTVQLSSSSFVHMFVDENPLNGFGPKLKSRFSG